MDVMPGLLDEANLTAHGLTACSAQAGIFAAAISALGLCHCFCCKTARNFKVSQLYNHGMHPAEQRVRPLLSYKMRIKFPHDMPTSSCIEC